MTFAAAPLVSDLSLSNYLKIVSKGIVYNNLSEDSPIWDMIKKKKKGEAEGRQLRYLLRSAYGADAVGFVPPTNGDYPNAHQATVNEAIAVFKDYALTVEVERTLISKAMSDFSRYGEPLAEEMRVKSIALSRLLSAAVYGDGSGVIAQASGAGTITSGVMVLNISNATNARGFIGNIELGDKILIKSNAGAAKTPTGGSGTFAYWLVNSKDRQAGTVTMTSYNTAGAIMANTATDVVDGNYLYKKNQTTFQDLTAISTNDYNTLSEFFPGLESLAENDGRKVNGITQTGALGGTRRDAAGNPIDSQDFQQLMSQLMIAVGQGRYKYSQAMMAWETLDALIESREVDRRFVDVKDNKRGVEGLGYIHGRNHVMFQADEFCPKQRIYVVPEGDVLQFHGSDFDFVQAQPGQKFHLNASANGGHTRAIRSYMEGSGVLVAVHPAAIGVIENFTV
jgi:hypothetical protein